MDLITWAILLLIAGTILLVGELLLPTHGVLGAMGLIGIGGGIGCCFALDRWLGLGLFVLALVLSPFLFTLAMKIWPYTPVGRRLMLQHSEKPLDVSVRPVKIGEAGVTVTEMRPMGEVDFSDMRLEAISDRGMLEAGTKVRVVSTDGGRAVVRPV